MIMDHAEERARAGESLESLRPHLPEGIACRMLTMDDADILRRFRQAIVQGLEDPDHYRLAGEVGDFVADHLGAKGLTAGLFDREGAMIGYGALGLPREGDPNRGVDMGLPEDELPLVAHIASAMLRPDWRKRGLHHRLIDWRVVLAAALGRRHLLTTVSPRNHQSWGHLVGHGLLGKRLIDVGGGLIRLLVHGDCRAAPRPSRRLGTGTMVPVEELAEAKVLFAAGNWVWRRVPLSDGRMAAELSPPVAESPAGDSPGRN